VLVAVEAACPREFGVQSPVDWTAIDTIAIIAVIWLIATFVYKGIRQHNVAKFPQISIMVPFSQWGEMLVRRKPPLSAGAAAAGFFKTIFVDVLGMNIFKCVQPYMKSPPELVRTRISKRAAKLLIVWGFILAAIATVINFVTLPHNCIPIRLDHPVRIFGVLAGILLIIGSSLWLAVRYKEVRYRGVWDMIGAELLPVLILLIAVSGFVLQAAIYLYYLEWPSVSWATRGFLYFAEHFHAVPLALLVFFFFWTKADHIVYRIFWRIHEYGYQPVAGRANSRLPPRDLRPLVKSRELQPGY
jgi:hypothetical protein